MPKQILLPLRVVDTLREFTLCSERTQPELKSILEISSPTAFRAVERLRRLGLLRNGKEVPSDTRGRPPTTLQLNPHGFCVFALVIRSDESKLYLVDALGRIQTSVSIPVSADDRYDAAINQYTAEILRLLPKAIKEYSITPGIGISFAGSVDSHAGYITTPSRFIDWRQKPIVTDLSTSTGLPCAVDNDATALTQASIWFATKPIPDSFALLYIDFGLGTGYCFEGSTYRGQNHVAAGLAHTNLFTHGWSQEQCHCGRIGCLETILSIPSVLKQSQAKDVQEITLSRPKMITALDELEKAARRGEANAYRILTDIGKKAGVIGYTLSKMLDLHSIIFAGGLTERSDTFWKGIDMEMTQQTTDTFPVISWWKLTDVLQNQSPEALGATAVALASLYRSRKVMVLQEQAST